MYNTPLWGECVEFIKIVIGINQLLTSVNIKSF
jgi:hypothetical protein